MEEEGGREEGDSEECLEGKAAVKGVGFAVVMVAEEARVALEVDSEVRVVGREASEADLEARAVVDSAEAKVEEDMEVDLEEVKVKVEVASEEGI